MKDQKLKAIESAGAFFGFRVRRCKDIDQAYENK